MPATATAMEKENLKTDSQCGCDATNEKLDDTLRESVAVSSQPIHSGIGMKDFVQMVREGVALRQTKLK